MSLKALKAWKCIWATYHLVLKVYTAVLGSRYPVHK